MCNAVLSRLAKQRRRRSIRGDPSNQVGCWTLGAVLVHIILAQASEPATAAQADSSPTGYRSDFAFGGTRQPPHPGDISLAEAPLGLRGHDDDDHDDDDDDGNGDDDDDGDGDDEDEDGDVDDDDGNIMMMMMIMMLILMMVMMCDEDESVAD